mgnify:CR=1 FL=1
MDTTSATNDDFEPTGLGTILSVWAHPDDETYLAAAVMAAASDNGQRVVCVTATAGERGTDDPVTWPPDRLGQVRAWEAAAAMAVLGVREHHLLGLPDGALERDDEWAIYRIGALIDSVSPDTILTFGVDGITFHSDHIAVHHWVTEAWERRGRPGRLLYATASTDYLARHRDLFEEWGIYMTDERPTGVPADELAVHIRLDEMMLDRKLTALRAMTTQTSGVMAAVDPDAYAAHAAEESFVDARATVTRVPTMAASSRA